MKKRFLGFCSTYPRAFHILFGIIVGILGTCVIWSGILNTSNSLLLLGLQYILWVIITFIIASILKLNKWWSILGFIGWIALDIILSNKNVVKKQEKIPLNINKTPSTTLQFLSIFGILGFGLYSIFNKDILTGIVALGILCFVIWYTKKYK